MEVGSLLRRSGGDGAVIATASHRVAAGPVALVRSNAALKVTMAVSGIAFVAYVFVHMVGNLKVFLGRDDMNHYAAFLREFLVPLLPHGWFLWIFRAVMAVGLIAHVGSAAVLTVRSRAAGRARTTRGRAVPWWRSFTSRTMAVSGVVIGAFVAFHIADLTLGVAGADEFRHPERVGGTTEYYAYENLVGSFERVPVALFYVVAMLALGAHTLHGAWSVIHDLGVTGAVARRRLWILGTVIAAAVVTGNIAIPLAVQFGVVS